MTDIQNTRAWVQRLAADPAVGFDDWLPYCQSAEGIFIDTRYEDIEPELPDELREARERLADHVVDERTLEQAGAPFNGPRYCLRSVIPEVRRFGEQSGCILTFGPSDYRTFLVTNGIEAGWAEAAGLLAFEDPGQWAERFGANGESCSFYRNSFGVNVLISALNEAGERCLFFRERGPRTAIRRVATGGSADEGLRRAFGDKLFDQKSSTDLAPDIERCAWRAVKEEIGLTDEQLKGSRPILLSVGQVRSICQPAAFYYWPLAMTVAEVRLHAATAQDRHLEFGESHFVRMDLGSVVKFVQSQEPKAPVESWVMAMALYSLQSKVTVAPPSGVFVSYSHRDAAFVDQLVARLEADGIEYWLDEKDLLVGQVIDSAISRAIQQHAHFLVVLSPASVQSRWLQRELTRPRTKRPKGESCCCRSSWKASRWMKSLRG